MESNIEEGYVILLNEKTWNGKPMYLGEHDDSHPAGWGFIDVVEKHLAILFETEEEAYKCMREEFLYTYYSKMTVIPYKYRMVDSKVEEIHE